MLPRFLLICLLAGSAFAQDPATLVRQFAIASMSDDRARSPRLDRGRESRRVRETLRLRARDVLPACVDPSGDAAALAHIAGARSVQIRWMQQPGHTERAIAEAQRGLTLAEESGDPDAVANALLRYGRSANVRASYERVLALADSIEWNSRARKRSSRA